MKAYGLIRVLCALLLACLLGLSMSAAQTVEVGSPAPDFTLQDLDGNEVQLSAFRGKVIALTFWGTSCKVAFEEQMPALQEQIYDAYGRDQVEVFSINITPGVSPDELKACRDENGITFPILLEGLRASMEYGIFQTPNLILIDKDGIIRLKTLGKLFDDEAKAILQQLVRELPVQVGSHVGNRALDFTLPQLDGEPVTLSAEVEKRDVVLLYFFYAAT